MTKTPILFCLLMAIPTSSLATPTQTTMKLGPVEVGKKMPSFGGWTVQNNMWSSREIFREKPPPNAVVVSYFATWCEPCKKGLPILWETTQETKTELILVAVESDTAKVEKYLEGLAIPAVTVMDKFNKIAMRHGVIPDGENISLPKTFLLDQSQIVRFIYTVEGDDFKEKISKDITSVFPPKAPQK